jgi:hypothetical protein
MRDWELEKGEEHFDNGLKGLVGVFRLVNVPLETTPIKIHWKSINLIESSKMELEEHQRWKDMMWLEGYSPGFTFKLRDILWKFICHRGEIGSW